MPGTRRRKMDSMVLVKSCLPLSVLFSACPADAQYTGCTNYGCPVVPVPHEPEVWTPPPPYIPKGVVARGSNGKLGSAIERYRLSDGKTFKKGWKKLTAEALADCQSVGGQDCKAVYQFEASEVAVAEPTGSERPNFAVYSSDTLRGARLSAVEDCEKETGLECALVLDHSTNDNKQVRYDKPARQLSKDPYRRFLTVNESRFEDARDSADHAGKPLQEVALEAHRAVLSQQLFGSYYGGTSKEQREFEATYAAAFNALVAGGMDYYAAAEKLFYEITRTPKPE